MKAFSDIVDFDNYSYFGIKGDDMFFEKCLFLYVTTTLVIGTTFVAFAYNQIITN